MAWKFYQSNGKQKLAVDGLTGGSGDVTGPSLSTDHAIVRFDGTDGKTLQNSGPTINNTGEIAMSGQKITGLADPVNDQDAATRAYVLANAGGSNIVTSDSLPGNVSGSSSYADLLSETIPAGTLTDKQVLRVTTALYWTDPGTSGRDARIKIVLGSTDLWQTGTQSDDEHTWHLVFYIISNGGLTSQRCVGFTVLGRSDATSNNGTLRGDAIHESVLASENNNSPLTLKVQGDLNAPNGNWTPLFLTIEAIGEHA